MNKVNWQCTVKSLFKLSVQGVGLGGNLISAIIPGVSETAQIRAPVSGSESLVCKCSILLFSNPGLANLWFKILLSSLEYINIKPNQKGVAKGFFLCSFAMYMLTQEINFGK